MAKNKHCNTCNKKVDQYNYEKIRTICRDCYNKEKRNYKQSSEKLSVYDNHINNRTLLVGPSFPGKTYLMFKFLSRMPNRDIYRVTKSPPEWYSNSKTKIKEVKKILDFKMQTKMLS